MPTFEIPIQVQSALIAGVVALAVAQLNNRFARQSQEDEHKRRRREWFLEKQARAAEEIVGALDKFLKEVAEKSSAVRSRLLIASLPDLFESEFVESKPQEDSRIIYELGEKSKNITASHDAWFTYDAARLAVWFDNPMQEGVSLDNLKSQFKLINGLLDRVVYRMFTSDLKNNQTYDSIQRDIENIDKEYKTLLLSASRAQQELVQKLWEG